MTHQSIQITKGVVLIACPIRSVGGDQPLNVPIDGGLVVEVLDEICLFSQLLVSFGSFYSLGYFSLA